MHAKQNIASRLGRWSAAHRKTAILGWLVFVVAVFGLMASGTLKKQTLSSVDQIAGNAGQAERILDDANMRPTEEIVLIQSENSTVDDPAFRATIEESAAALAATKHVTDVVSPLSGGGGGISADRRSAFVEFEIEGKEEVAEGNLDASIATVDRIKQDNPEYTVGQFGGGSANKAIKDTLQGDVGKAGMLSLPITLLILLVALGALVAASVPLVLALTSVLATMAIVTIPSQLFALGGNVDALILLIGLAVGVDYSLFYMRREREERAAGRSTRDALEVAAATSGRAVMISGLTVVIAMAGMFITGDATFISFAVATVTVVLVAMFATLAVLPAVLAWLGDRVEKGRIPFSRRRRGEVKESRFWGSIVSRVMRRPVVSIVVAGGLLLALAIPALGMNVVQTGSDDLPRDIPVMKTYDRFTAAFPAETNAVQVVVKSDDVHGGQVGAEIEALVGEAEASKTVVGESEITYSDDGSVASIAIPTQGKGTDEQSLAALDEIRGEIVPATVGGVEDATVKVTGAAAQSSDFGDLLGSRMPLVFAFVLGLAFLLMLATFRSIVIPIKAIVLNLLSVGAAYGVLVLTFQKGWGEQLLGFQSNGGVTNWLPLFLFVILFGLSMDYHVFILSRVREAYDRGMSTEDAVRKGIAGSAGTVTSAAIVMVMVFSVFATLSFIDFKEMGVGLAVAILIDATIIRGVLLPATMKLLGDWNWYLPKWLEWLPQAGRESRRAKAAPVQAEPARA
ncbi:MAG TPA: MMPL family transporter [Solirubrobacterales bacterium]|jgi:RND superfamily putative drug exporter|nr:MMPL family transporter [Solirubrobacterales bacterium]